MFQDERADDWSEPIEEEQAPEEPKPPTKGGMPVGGFEISRERKVRPP